MPSDARPLGGRVDDSACVARAAGGGPGEGKLAHPQLWRHGHNLLVKGQRRGRTSTGSGWLADMGFYDTEGPGARNRAGVV